MTHNEPASHPPPDIVNPEAVLHLVREKFTSGNQHPVDQITIRRSELESMRPPVVNREDWMAWIELPEVKDVFFENLRRYGLDFAQGYRMAMWETYVKEHE